MADLLRVGDGDTVTPFQSPPAVDGSEEVMESQGPAAVLVLVSPAEDLFEGDLVGGRHRYDVGMDMRRALVQMYDKRQDVILPEPAGEDVIHVSRPALDFLTSVYPPVVGTRGEVDLLSAKSQLAQPLVRAADDEVHDRPDPGVLRT